MEKHRIVNVAGPKEFWGSPLRNLPDRNPADPTGVRGRADHHGLKLSEALKDMGVADPSAQRPERFFANKEHEKVFEKMYPSLKPAIANLERSGNRQNVKALRDAAIASANSIATMDPATQSYFYAFCQQRNVLA